MGDCGLLLSPNDLAESRSGGAVQRGQYSRHPLYSSCFRGGSTPISLRASAPVGIGAAKAPTLSALSLLVVFFLKTDSLTSGSGLAIVPFLEEDLVRQTGSLNGREFLVTVSVVMLSLGPVLSRPPSWASSAPASGDSQVSAIEIFLSSLFLIAAPILLRHRANPNVQGFVKGAYIFDRHDRRRARAARPDRSATWLTPLIGADGLAVLFRWRVSSPRLIAVTAVIGLITFPILQRGGYW